MSEEKSLALTLKTDEKGLVITNNLEEQAAHAGIMIKSGMLPKAYTSASQVVVALQYAAELGLPRGITSLRQIAVINGSPAIYGDLPLSIVYNSGKIESLEEFLFDENCKQICLANKNLKAKAYGACCRVKRKGEEAIHECFFTMDDAKKANLGNVWNKFPKDLLKYRARTRALKDKFPDVLNGVATAEFDHNVIPNGDSGPLDSNISGPQESDLNERFEIETDVQNELGEKLKKAVLERDTEIVNTAYSYDGDLPDPKTSQAESIEDIIVEEELSPIEDAMIQESKEKESSKKIKAKVAKRQKAEVETEEATARFDKEVAKTKSNVDWDKVSPEIKAEIQQEKEAAAAKKLAAEVPWEEEGTKVKKATAGDYMIPSGTYGGKTLNSFKPKELQDYQKLLRAHLSEKPDSVDAKAVYRAIATYWAEEGVS